MLLQGGPACHPQPTCEVESTLETNDTRTKNSTSFDQHVCLAEGAGI